jgi:hypothetical protein
MFINLEKWSKKPLWINSKNILACNIREVERIDESKKPIIIDSKGTVVKDYFADIIMAQGLAFNIRFEKKEQAEKFLLDNIINA